MALIRTLSHGAIAVTGSGRTAAARVVVGGAAATPPAIVIREAADLLARVVDASDQRLLAAPAGAGSSAAVSRSTSGLGTAPAHPSAPPSASNSSKQLQATASGKQRHDGTSVTAAAAGPSTAALDACGGSTLLSPRPAALLPSVVTDHTSGLAVLRTWSSK